jgi:hypothetical protein
MISNLLFLLLVCGEFDCLLQCGGNCFDHLGELLGFNLSLCGDECRSMDYEINYFLGLLIGLKIRVNLVGLAVISHSFVVSLKILENGGSIVE